MTTSQATALPVQTRTPEGSRAARRLRRSGKVPGVVYGGGQDPLSFEVDARDLRLALAHAGALLDLAIDGQSQSGHPGSPHYRDQFLDWLAGRLHALVLEDNAAPTAGGTVQLLEPVAGS